ncbi:DMT family transporter [Bradyrhizobium prioriisuperbiae]|uniref:DMT family transporter n=1 Tax=Bradyrhizobium prioriisuperbiae TaxID=2854389 RepID=UPI0028EC312E|nr:DMT family transporter [Bradyrhizobium prioritasuperba]
MLSLVLIWAVSWPVIKIGIGQIPPIWYGCLRYAIAALILFGLVAVRGELALPPRSDLSLVVISGALQMAAYSALTGLALTILPPGRASVLAFSTPVLVAPLAAWRLGEKMSSKIAAGVMIGCAGIVIIASPSFAIGGKQAMAYAMLMGAATAWAIAIVTVRGHRFKSSALNLAPWQMLIAAMLLFPVAMFIEGFPGQFTLLGVATLAYVAPVATAFAYWAVVEAGRRFAASTMSMALLATPSLGLLISAWVLDEPINASLLTGVLLTATGIRLTVTR